MVAKTCEAIEALGFANLKLIERTISTPRTDNSQVPKPFKKGYLTRLWNIAAGGALRQALVVPNIGLVGWLSG